MEDRKMRKLFYALAVVAACSVVSCNKLSEPQIEEEIQTSTIKFDITVNRDGFDSRTKAVKSAWENGDKVYVFFDSTPASADDLLIMTYNGSSWAYAPGANVEAALGTSGKLFAVYSSETPTITYGGNVKFDGSADGTSLFLLAEKIDYTVDENKLKATLNLSLDNEIIVAQISITGLTGSGWYIQEADGGSMLLSHIGVQGNSYGWNGSSASSGWGGKHYFSSYGGDLQTFVFVNYWARGARNWKLNLSNGVNTYQKTFSSKTLDNRTAVKFAGPNDLDNPTNGWSKLLPVGLTLPGTLTDEDF